MSATLAMVAGTVSLRVSSTATVGLGLPIRMIQLQLQLQTEALLGQIKDSGPGSGSSTVRVRHIF